MDSYFGTIGGGSSGSTPLTSTWSAKPTAASSAGQIRRMTDVGQGQSGTGGGVFFYSNGTRWKPLNNTCVVDEVDSANVGTATTAEQQLTPNHVAIPAGVIGDFDRIDLQIGMSKSGTTESCQIRVRFGPLGTTADPVIVTDTSMSGASQSYGANMSIKRLTSTTVQVQGSSNTGNAFGGSATGTYAAAITVSNMDSNPMYISVTAQMSAGVEIPTCQLMVAKLTATDNS